VKCNKNEGANVWNPNQNQKVTFFLYVCAIIVSATISRRVSLNTGWIGRVGGGGGIVQYLARDTISSLECGAYCP
jgi:hypothetical protein